MVTRMVRHYDQDERQSDASLNWDAMGSVLLKFQKSLAYFRAIQGHSDGIPIDPELMGTCEFLTIGKHISRIGVVSSSSQSIFEKGLIPGGKESDKGWPDYLLHTT